jgi:hypothetical protein
METSQPENECDPEVYEKGECVWLVAGLCSTAIEAVVVRVREETGAKVDWHYMAGRGLIRVVGDDDSKEKVRKSMRMMTPTWQNWPVG